VALVNAPEEDWRQAASRTTGGPYEVVDKPVDHGRGECGLSVGAGFDGGDEFPWRCALQQEPGCSGPKRLEHVVVEVEGCQHEHPGVSRHAQKLSGRGDAVASGHLDVHQHHIWFELTRELDGGLTVGALTDDLDLRVHAEHGGKAGS